MESFETITHKTSEKVRKLLDDPASNDYHYRQVQLAVEKFVQEHTDTVLDDEKLEEIMMDWATSPLGKKFREIAHDPEFSKTHEGDISKITLEEVTTRPD